MIESRPSRRAVLAGALLLGGGAVAPSLLTEPSIPHTGDVTLVAENDPQPLPQSGPIFHDGISFTSRKRGELATPQARETLRYISEIGAKSVAIVPTALQEGLNTTEIFRHSSVTSSDKEVRDTIRQAHDQGLSVMLKPHIDIDGFRDWRGKIGESFRPEEWSKWFGSYRNFILPYAEIAESEGVELFSVGTELKQTSRMDQQWRSIIQDVCREYSGATTYAAQHSGEEEAIVFWDDLDFIGIDAYYPLSQKVHPTSADLQQAWISRLNSIAILSHQFEREVVFTEHGYRNVLGTTMNPEEYLTIGPRDDAAQADALDATFQMLRGQEIVKGSFLWEYKAIPDDPRYDISHSPQGKMGETVIRKHFRKMLVDI